MKQKPVALFFIRLIIFCVVVLAVDRLLGYAFKKVYFGQTIGQFSQTTYAIDSTRDDILIFGSSRALRHYSSSIVSAGMGLSCYNAGKDGMMIPYVAAIQKIILNRYTPKLIILDIGANELVTEPSKYERLSILLPYYSHHPELKPNIQEISRFEPYKLISQTYPFNSSIFILATNMLFPQTIKIDDNGYLPREGIVTKNEMDMYIKKMQQRALKTRAPKDNVDKKAVEYFKFFLNNAAKRNIKTVVIIPPTIIRRSYMLDNQLKEREIIEAVARRYPNVELLDYSADSRFNYHPEKFSDLSHLNTQGAEEYTTIITNYLKAHYKF